MPGVLMAHTEPPGLPWGELRVALCSSRSFLSTQNTRGCSPVLGPAAWTATGDDGKGSISSFLSSVSLFSVCGVGISPSQGRLSSALIPQTFCCWLQQRNLCRIDGVFSVNAWEHSEQGRVDGNVLLQRIPATSGLTLRRDAGFHFSRWQLGYSSKIITGIVWECWKLSKAVLRWCWVVFPA